MFRFAPSPNGALHLGHALSAMLNYDLARKLGGRFLVRIEDIDQVRCTDDYIAAALDDLAWLGVVWEQPVMRQSHRFGAYGVAADALTARGLTYPCGATRRELMAAIANGLPRDPDGAARYASICGVARGGGGCSATPDDGRYALRLDQTAAREAADLLDTGPLIYRRWDTNGFDSALQDVIAEPAAWGDAVLIRKDTPASYHLACVVDDAAQGVTHVVRGQDLEKSTDFHVLLQRLLRLPTPVYHHHRLVTDPNGRKLAKRDKDTALQHYRASGYSPDDIREILGLGMRA